MSLPVPGWVGRYFLRNWPQPGAVGQPQQHRVVIGGLRDQVWRTGMGDRPGRVEALEYGPSGIRVSAVSWVGDWPRLADKMMVMLSCKCRVRATVAGAMTTPVSRAVKVLAWRGRPHAGWPSDGDG